MSGGDNLPQAQGQRADGASRVGGDRRGYLTSPERSTKGDPRQADVPQRSCATIRFVRSSAAAR